MSFVRAMVFVTFLPMSIFTQSTAIAQSDEQVERWQNAIKYDTGGSYKCGTRRNFPIKWLIPGPKLYMSDEVAGNAVTHDELARVVDHFNYVVANNSPAKPKITLLPRSANSQATMEYGNGVNEIYFLDEVEIGEGLYGRVRGNRASSATTAFHSTCYYREIDIQIRRFSPAGPLFWSSYEYGAGFSGPTRHIGLVLLHEFGHFFSLKHDAQVSRTMNNSYPQGGTIGSAYQAELFGKDRSEIWAIYKHTDQSTDLAASA